MLIISIRSILGLPSCGTKTTMEKKWVIKDAPNNDKVKRLSNDLNINEILSSILVQRGIEDFETAKKFFRPTLDELHDPFLMKDMEKAVNRVSEAISNEEKILIYGDYDVDGTTSVALVFSFLKKYSTKLDFYIPDRYSEGYGVSDKAIDWAIENEFDLIIALDCGIKAVSKVARAKKSGIDFIICDHHLPGEELPEALAVLDPKRPDCGYPYKELPGCGIGFKLLMGFCLQNTIDLNELYEYIDLVAVSIASDIVPITGENRILEFYGLKKINHSPTAGLKALVEISGLKPPISVSDLVFYIGPRINASGRLTHAKESVNVLIDEDTDALTSIAKDLNDRNVERRNYDSYITAEALELIETNPTYLEAKSTVLYKEDWHKGVIGIVASRCTEHYYRPTIILTSSNGKATGSARSVKGFNIHDAILECEDLLDQFGGHQFAAGLTLPLENVDRFRDRFEEVVSSTISPDLLIPKMEIDYIVPLEFVNFKTQSIINQMAPFGPMNPKPTFGSESVYLKYPAKVLKDEHLKLTIFQKGSGKSFSAIGFGLGEHSEKMNPEDPFKIAFQIEENDYQGYKSLQLVIKDIKFYD